MAKSRRPHNTENSGRPPKYDLDVEAQKLLDWSSLPNSIRLQDFCDDKDYSTYELHEYAERNNLFALAMKKAKDRIASRRELWCMSNIMNTSVYNKTIHNYCHVMRKHDKDVLDEELVRKKELLEFDAKLKAENGQGTADEMKNLDSALNLVNYLQTHSARKMDDKSSNADAKS